MTFLILLTSLATPTDLEFSMSILKVDVLVSAAECWASILVRMGFTYVVKRMFKHVETCVIDFNLTVRS